MGNRSSDASCERYRFRPETFLAVAVLLYGAQPTGSGSGLCWVASNGVAPARLLLRARGRSIHSRSELRDRTVAEELFDARYRHARCSRAAGTTHALVSVE